MNKQPTESSGEQFSASPELGFAFGRISLETALGFLTSEEMRVNKEAQSLSFGLDVTRQYFKEGADLTLWEAHLAARHQARILHENHRIPEAAVQKYEEIIDLLHTEYLDSIGGEKEVINKILQTYPGVLTSDKEGALKLVGVDTVSNALNEREVMTKAPVRQVAFWSDESQTEVELGMPLYVDMTALPETFSEDLNRYRVLYGVTIDQ